MWRQTMGGDQTRGLARDLGYRQVLLMVLSALMAGGCSSVSKENYRTVPPPPTVSAYRIQVGDELEISFYKTPELNRVRMVGPDGTVALDLVGNIQVAGRTIADVSHQLGGFYSRELVNPQFVLSVREYSGLKVYVGGEVNEPGVLAYHGGLTLIQAIMQAGGPKASGTLGEVVVIRRGPDGQPIGALVDVNETLLRGGLGGDVMLATSDIIFVPRSRIANVNLFVKQYIKDNLPIYVSMGFGNVLIR